MRSGLEANETGKRVLSDAHGVTTKGERANDPLRGLDVQPGGAGKSENSEDEREGGVWTKTNVDQRRTWQGPSV